jgi:hypothetical protein
MFRDSSTGADVCIDSEVDPIVVFRIIKGVGNRKGKNPSGEQSTAEDELRRKTRPRAQLF